LAYYRVVRIGLATAAVACREQVVEDYAKNLQALVVSEGAERPSTENERTRIAETRSIQEISRESYQ
jgi:glutamate dehydrogenase/leucine dehydrogenase